MNPNMAPFPTSTPSSIPRKPSFERTISSPPSSPPSPSSVSKTSKLGYLQQPSSLSITTQLTPPTSPEFVRSNTEFGNSITSVRFRQSPASSSSPQSTCTPEVEARKQDIPLILECPFDIEIAKNAPLFGQGAWSNVYRAVGRRKDISCATLPPTPPPSPQSSVPLLVAVKVPVSNSSRTILHNEAIVLTHLTRMANHDDFIVHFYGYITSSVSLVLAPVPLPLSSHILARARFARAHSVESVSTDPVIGSISTWLSLADKLVIALAWLHNEAGVVHGDIKPGNILLSPNRSADDFAFQPLLIDFSSSHVLSSARTTSNTLSALTREYTAPELLSPAVLRDPSSTATIASDIFSLAVTLIVAATGEVMVYEGNLWQRQYMSQHGWNILEFVRNGEGGMRIPSGGVVEAVVEAAVRKIDQGRIDAGKWKELVKTAKRTEEEIRKTDDSGNMRDQSMID